MIRPSGIIGFVVAALSLFVTADARGVVYVKTLTIDAPGAGATVGGVVLVGGWALDLAASSGTGVSAVHVYRDGPAGSGVGLGVASYGGSRPDVAAAYGSSQFTNSGWGLSWDTSGLSPGSHTLYVYAYSTVTGTWKLQTRTVTSSP